MRAPLSFFHGSSSYLHSFLTVIFLSFLLSHSFHAEGFPTSQAASFEASSEPTCKSAPYDPFDYSVKIKPPANAPVCLNPYTARSLFSRADKGDYSCSETKPCSNGACCTKATGQCGFGPEACGTTDQSPNDICWSNCDAKAECGRYAEKEGQECPLNVCCSKFGFCGMTDEFCKVTDDKDDSCQSNCKQPGSGAKDGDVQGRVIGYYEAWVANKTCYEMRINDIPVDAMTHLQFSFAYITPGTYEIVPMDGIDPELFMKFTNLKRKNSGLKIMVSLGGWTFNDNGTATQPVFGDVARTEDNRSKFITQLLSFMRHYAFDGVDFDWEYPGASDRGGQEDDGANFVKLLKELQDAIKNEPIDYIVSFTAPTSYWYLRHFDLKAVDHVDWVNIMSYDLHGVWDSWNPIGSQVLAHTNLTEIKQALDLYWRNDVPANKLNLGLGLYGRSFQLSDPTCYKAGCGFRAGGTPGTCSDNSGTLSYNEIQQIVKEKKLKPYHDKDAQVKYIVWNNDQWCSYDDEETFKAKIDFANKLGLGGLLIWSIDQDTSNLDGLKGILGKKGIAAFADKAEDASYWQSIGAQDCYVSDCGGTCKTGFISITHQPCGGAKPVTRHSKKKDSALCCPISAAPKASDCTWRGSAPSCNGHCEENEVTVELNRWGSGKYCEDGNKAYCCKNQGLENTCYWTGVGGTCKKGDEPLTFAGTFLEQIADLASWGGLFGAALSDALNDVDMDLRRLYCCPPDMMKQWTNCGWHGTPGSCYDNHCNLGHQVQLTQSDYGAGQSCGARLERTRVFCCDAAEGKSPFLPVSLDYLFPNPPSGDDVDTDFDIKIDNTWGDGDEDTSDDEDPDQASFAFWVMTSPEEIQVSLDKRDGSHWELYNCNDAASEELQTVQMICTDNSPDSNCHAIGKGHGVRGTIIQMPKGQGCGPAKYAVAESLEVSQNQTLPGHLAKRNFGHRPVVYDLKFGYEWSIVPRDMGNTQLRVDFSNEEGYWDSIVNKAGNKKKKRSLEDIQGNHKRWLEDEWRDDVHFGGLSTHELHARWFGSDVIDWLKGFFNPDIKTTYTHDYEGSLTAVILQDDWSCDLPDYGVNLQANIDARATANIKMSSSFGLTILATLGTPLDLSQSYLYLRTSGEVSAIFSVDALAKAKFDSGEFSLANLPFPGASFSIPKLFSVGPRFYLKARAEAEIEIDGHFETKVDIASWDFQQTYPEANDDWKPKGVEKPSRDLNLKGLEKPTMDLSVTASGHLTAHVIPTLSFGIEFDDYWDIGKCAAELLVDGWVRARAEADLVGGDVECPYRYAIDAGSKITARAAAPDAFKWNAKSIDLFPIDRNLVPGDGESQWKCPRGTAKRRRDVTFNDTAIDTIDGLSISESHGLSKRGPTYGPFFHIPKVGSLCPTTGNVTDPDCNTIKGYDTSQLSQSDDANAATKRSTSLVTRGHSHDSHHGHTHMLSKRAARSHTFCMGPKRGAMTISFEGYPRGAALYDCDDWSDCNNFGFGQQGATQPSHNYIQEHILELQMVKIFMDTTFPEKDGICRYLKGYWEGKNAVVTVNGIRKTAWNQMAMVFPTQTSAYGTLHGHEMVTLEEEINLAKERAFSNVRGINDEFKMQDFVSNEDTVNNAIRSLKNAVLAYKYMATPAINNIYYTQAIRMGDQFEAVENALGANYRGSPTQYQKKNLKAAWLKFIKNYTTRTEKKFQEYFDQWVESLNGWIPTNPTPDQMSPTRQILVNKINRISAEIQTLRQPGNTWQNPF